MEIFKLDMIGQITVRSESKAAVSFKAANSAVACVFLYVRYTARGSSDYNISVLQQTVCLSEQRNFSLKETGSPV